MPGFNNSMLGNAQVVRLLRKLADVVESNELVCIEHNVKVHLPGCGNVEPRVDNNSYLKRETDHLTVYSNDVLASFTFNLYNVPSENNKPEMCDAHNIVDKLDLQNVLFPDEQIKPIETGRFSCSEPNKQSIPGTR